MKNIFLLVYFSCVLSCFSQKENKSDISAIYFSDDNGLHWKKADKGLPENIKIGLGGLAASSSDLILASKEQGVFLYDEVNQLWKNLPINSEIISANLGATIIFKNKIFLGTQTKGIYFTGNQGKTWQTANTKLKNLTIRRFHIILNQLYVCTNGGFYRFNEKEGQWTLEFDKGGVQINAATYFKGSIYLATNIGIFKNINDSEWKNILPNNSVHNIYADTYQIFAMTYSQLLISSLDGQFWNNAQQGLPKTLYTFNILSQNNQLWASQWDGIYKKKINEAQWTPSSNGLSPNFAATNLIFYKNWLITSTSERKLKAN